MIIEIVALRNSVSERKISLVSHRSYFQQSGVLQKYFKFLGYDIAHRTKALNIIED